MEVYIKTFKKITITSKDSVILSDIADIYAPDQILGELKNLEILLIKKDLLKNNKQNFLITIIQIVEKIKSIYPYATIKNFGENDTVIDYIKSFKKENRIIKWSKIIFVSIILLAGSSTAIMTFHNDVQLNTIFRNYHKIFFSETVEKSNIINISYSIGLTTGIIIFFNHIFGKKISQGPTPIEVEITKYEKDVEDTIIDNLNLKK